ncbi:heat shock protein [Nymphaea thermarum]|nr:heat shock protein [Nymphaea thermarum]
MSLIPSFFDRAVASPTPSPLLPGFPLSSSRSRPRREKKNVKEEPINTKIDWKETSEAHVFKADLLGPKKEEVKVEIEGDRMLQISGERSKEVEEKKDRWHQVKRSQGKSLNLVHLPQNIKVDQVRAEMENEPRGKETALFCFARKRHF